MMPIGVRTDPFAMVSSAAIADSELARTDVMIYMALCYHADNRTGKCSPAIPTICERARCSKGSVYPSLEKLAKKGYIAGASRLSEEGDRESSVYTVKYIQARGVVKSRTDPLVQTRTEGVVKSRTGNYIPSSNQTSGADAPAAKEASPQPFVTSLFFEKYIMRLGQKPAWTGKEGKRLKEDLGRLGSDKLAACVRLFFDSPPRAVAEFILKAGCSYGVLHSQLPKLEEVLGKEERRLRLLKTCRACGKASDTTGIDCPKCGEPDAYQEAHRAAK